MKLVSSPARRGFTLIELLVVIAIIGILSAVVLASLNTARNKGADAAIKSNIDNARAAAELFYDSATPNSYSGVCASSNGVLNMKNGASSAGSATVGCADPATVSGATGWKLYGTLKTDATKYYCVDSTGTATTTGTAEVATTVTC